MLRTVSRITAILLVTLFLFSCKTSKIFNKGHVQLPTQQHTIPIHFVNNWPLVNVQINDKDYVFLLDTGAPTVISKKIYDDLNIKPYVQQKVTDSQGESAKQDFVVISEMLVESLRFQEIGAVVMDLWATEFFCHRIDGILGANQMAKLAWKINYNEGTAVVAQDFAD